MTKYCFKIPRFISFFQKLCGSLPFLTKGPYSEFYGGPALLNLIDTEVSDQHRQNYSWYLICLLSPILHVFLMIYKKIKNRQDNDYVISLRHSIVTGARSPFKFAFLSLSFFCFFLFLLFHFLYSINLEKVTLSYI